MSLRKYNLKSWINIIHSALHSNTIMTLACGFVWSHSVQVLIRPFCFLHSWVLHLSTFLKLHIYQTNNLAPSKMFFFSSFFWAFRLQLFHFVMLTLGTPYPTCFLESMLIYSTSKQFICKLTKKIISPCKYPRKWKKKKTLIALLCSPIWNKETGQL